MATAVVSSPFKKIIHSLYIDKLLRYRFFFPYTNAGDFKKCLKFTLLSEIELCWTFDPSCFSLKMIINNGM